MDIPKLKNQKIERKKHEDACAIFRILELQIKNKQSIKEYSEKIKDLWRKYFTARGIDVSEGENLEKNKGERVLVENAITRAIILYCIVTDIRYEDLTDDEEFEISMNVEFIKKLLKLKMTNFGAQIAKEAFGENATIDLTEKGIVVITDGEIEEEIPN